MFFIEMLMLLMLVISAIMVTLALILSKKTFYDREKNSPFECGFDPNSSARIPFSLQFFLIAVIFLIFDVEITLLLPLMVIMKLVTPMMLIMTTSVFIIILLLGLYHEWSQGALTWAY